MEREDRMQGPHGDGRIEILLRVTPSSESVAIAVRALEVLVAEHPAVPVRLAGFDNDGSHVHLILGIGLGTLEQVKTATSESREAVLLLQHIADGLAGFDPCFVELPDPNSREAELARRVDLWADGGSMSQVALIGR